MGIGVIALGEEIGQNSDDIVAVLAFVAVYPGVQIVATPGDLGVDEPAPVCIVE